MTDHGHERDLIGDASPEENMEPDLEPCSCGRLKDTGDSCCALCEDAAEAHAEWERY